MARRTATVLAHGRSYGCCISDGLTARSAVRVFRPLLAGRYGQVIVRLAPLASCIAGKSSRRGRKSPLDQRAPQSHPSSERYVVATSQGIQLCGLGSVDGGQHAFSLGSLSGTSFARQFESLDAGRCTEKLALEPSLCSSDWNVGLLPQLGRYFACSTSVDSRHHRAHEPLNGEVLCRTRCMVGEPCALPPLGTSWSSASGRPEPGGTSCRTERTASQKSSACEGQHNERNSRCDGLTACVVEMKHCIRGMCE
jgi:hypothetical protein